MDDSDEFVTDLADAVDHIMRLDSRGTYVQHLREIIEGVQLIRTMTTSDFSDMMHAECKE